VREGRKHGGDLGSDYLEIHYEDLVQNPRQVLSRLSRFVEQDLDYERIQKIGVGAVSHPNSSFAVETGGGEFTPVERWRNSLDARQVAVLDELIGETLQELGYPLESSGTRVAGRSLARMRNRYRWYFDLKLRLKRDTALGRVFASRDLSWV
jgi:hypothetical protein